MATFSSSMGKPVVVGGKEAQVVWAEGPSPRFACVPRAGGEVGSLQALHRGQWVETLHRALDYSEPKNEWRGRAPLQWPAVGRNCVPEELDAKKTSQDLMMGSWRCEGRRYPMPILGFAQYMEFDLAGHGADGESAWVECRATAGDYSRQFYPYDFELLYRHTIGRDGLRTRLTVRNREPERRFYFSLGNHITFHLPFTKEGRFEDCTLIAPTTHHAALNAQDLLDGRKLPKDLRRGATLADKDLWNLVLVGFTRDNASVELRDPHSFGFRISQREVPSGPPCVPAEDIRFVLYAEPQFKSFCPEPWIGEPNSLNSQRAVIHLQPAQEFVWEMGVVLLTR